MKVILRKITVQYKGSIKDGDFRAFLEYIDTEDCFLWGIRGYGTTPEAAAKDALTKYIEDFEYYTEDGPFEIK